jgi:pimeloyl-ACP methyl ester carboxylesterase
VSTSEVDEFGLFRQNVDEAGLPWSGPPQVRRETVTTAGGQRVSCLVWGSGPPQLALLHGGAQNAHTWDTVALALNRPLVAIDLPGHGRSDWRADRDYWPLRNAEAVAEVIDVVAPTCRTIVGMSLGGLTGIRLAAERGDRVDRLVVVDVTPGVDEHKSAPIAEFVDGPESFASFDDLLDRTVRYNPTRSVTSLRRGLLHNARPLPDGRWAWRYDRLRPPGGKLRFTHLWNDVSRLRIDTMLVLGAQSGVVTPDDVAEFRRRKPDLRVEVVADAGHSVQGDQPVRLAQLISGMISSQPGA